MNKLRTIQFAVILACASLLAACGSAVLPTANSGAATVNVPTVAALATANPAAPASSPTPAPAATLAAATSAAPGSAAADACALLKNEDVNKVLGQTFVPVKDNGLYGVCAYTFQLSRVDLTITHTGGTQFMKTTRTNLADSGLNIPGLGDEALYNVNSSALFVRKGEAVYLLSYLDSMVTQADKIAKESTLAALLLSRLK